MAFTFRDFVETLKIVAYHYSPVSKCLKKVLTTTLFLVTIRWPDIILNQQE